MAIYQNIVYQKEAQQYIVDLVNQTVPLSVNLDGTAFPTYRDSQGFFTYANTKYGMKRVNETNWVMLESASVPPIPSIQPQSAVGSIEIIGNANGDGVVSFSYDTKVYEVTPMVGDTPETTAENLANIINFGGQLNAILNGNIIDLTAIAPGSIYNIPLVDLTTDTTQSLNLVGMNGGVDYVAGVPGIPAIYSVWTNEDFNHNFELVI